MTLAEQLAAEGIRLRHYGLGDQKILCPQCSHTRRNKSDPCLSVKIDDDGATWKCHHCGWRGGVSDRPRAAVLPASSKPVRLGNPDPLPAEGRAFFAARKIGPETLSAFGIGWGRHWVGGSEAPCIVFPYRRDGAVVNAKYRTLDKKFSQAKGGEKVFFGLDRADWDLGPLVICEGEIDALSLTEAGVANAVSVPDGAPQRVKDEDPDPATDKAFSYVWAAKDFLERFDKIVLATDADGPGQALAEELARRIGREKCWLVTWPSGCKDANDVLVRHGPEALAECIERAQPHPIKSLFDAGHFENEVLALYRGGRKRGLSTGWRALDPLMTIRQGEFSVVTGIPGSGKSEFIDALMMNLAVNYDWRFALCSFENPPDEHLAKLAEKYVGQPFWEGPRPRMTETDLALAMDWIRERFFFIRAEDESPTIDWILSTAAGAVMRHGIKGLVIDPYNEIEHKRPSNMSETEYVSEIIAKVKRFAASRGVHVWFVAHPAKLYRDKEGNMPVPSLYDISGSAHWANKADIGIAVERDYAEGSVDVRIHVKKVRFKAVGKQGVALLHFDRATGRYSDPPAAEEPRRYGMVVD